MISDRNFRLLLAHLAERLHAARSAEENTRLANRLGRVVKAFLDDHPTGTTRDKGKILLDEVALALDDTTASDMARLEVDRLRREFRLTESLTEQIDRFNDFRERVGNLRYQQRLANQSAAQDGANASPQALPASAPVESANPAVKGVKSAAKGEKVPAPPVTSPKPGSKT